MKFIAGCYFFNEEGEKYIVKSSIQGGPPGSGNFLGGGFDNYLQGDKRIPPKDRRGAVGQTKIEKTTEQAKFDPSQLNLFAILLPHCRTESEREEMVRYFILD